MRERLDAGRGDVVETAARSRGGGGALRILPAIAEQAAAAHPVERLVERAVGGQHARLLALPDLGGHEVAVELLAAAGREVERGAQDRDLEREQGAGLATHPHRYRKIACARQGAGPTVVLIPSGAILDACSV